MGTSANGLDVITFCTKSGFDSKPNPIGRETEMAGRASSVFDMTAVALLYEFKTNFVVVRSSD